MERRRIKGVEIPKAIWYNPQLTLIEKCVLVEIKATQEEIFDINQPSKICAVDSKICTVIASRISNNYIADFAGCSKRSVTNILQKLERLNYIIIKNGNSSQRLIVYVAGEIEKTTTQNLLGCEENSKKIKKVTQKNKKRVSKKVNKKNIFNLSAGAHTHEEQKFEIESYEEILDNLDVHGVYRMAVFNFIKHLQANGCKVINSRLESLVIALDRRYRTNDIEKCVEIKTAITNGYKRLPCEEYWGLN